MTIQWIASGGGPLVCCEASVAATWAGSRGSSTGSLLSDYQRACQVDGFVGVVATADSHALVFGDEPLQSTFVMTSTGMAVARWVSCLSNALAIDVLARLPTRLSPIEVAQPVTFSNHSLLLFDSALSAPANHSTLKQHVTPGSYLVNTERFHEANKYEFLVHRFVLVDRA